MQSLSPEDHEYVRGALRYLQGLVDHELSSVGVSAGQIDGLDLGPVASVLEALGNPQHSLRIVHVTGTNGKGTVCRMVESLVTVSGLRVGTYLSPEGTVNERIRLDQRPVEDQILADAVWTVRGVAEHLEIALTAFEAITLCALVVFADAPVDVAVVEVGLLGRYDATNIVDADVAVITTVGGDHTDFKPGWAERVASEKAGIIKPKSIAVLGDIDDALVPVFAAEGPATLLRLGDNFSCEESRLAVGGRAVELLTTSGDRHEVLLPLFGEHQGDNAAVALTAAEAILGTPLSREVIETAFAEVRTPGRIELLAHSPVIVIDGGHNEQAAAALGRTLAESFTIVGRRIAVIGMLAGRDPARLLRPLHEHFPLDLVLAVEMNSPRAMSAKLIAEAAEHIGIATVVVPSLEIGLQRAYNQAEPEDLVLVTGSFRLMDDARATFRKLSTAAEAR